MREIKFRIWDKGEGKFLYQTLRELVNGIGDDCADWEAQAFRYALKRAFVPEEYIGRKDKNKTEIYEGDKIRHWGGDITRIGVVKYIKKKCSFDAGWGSWEHCAKDIEVIGNIHESKEE